jgi:hypothetical protein
MTEELVYKTDKWVTIPEVKDVVKNSLVLNHFPIGLKLIVDLTNKKFIDVDISYLKKYSEQPLFQKQFEGDNFNGEVIVSGSLDGIIGKIHIQSSDASIQPNNLFIVVTTVIDELTDRFFDNSKIAKENHALLVHILEKVIFPKIQSDIDAEKVRKTLPK